MINRSVAGNRQEKQITEKPRNPILKKTIIPIRANCGAVVVKTNTCEEPCSVHY